MRNGVNWFMKMAGYKFTRVELGLGCAVIYGIFFWICGACSQAIASTIQSPTWSNIIHSIGLAIVATMVFWIANRFFMYPLCGLLTGYNLVFKPPMKPEWMPVNPCEGCTIEGVHSWCHTERCDKLVAWKSNISALIAYTEWLIKPNQFGCFDYSWETPDGKIHHGIDVQRLESILKDLKEGK